MHQYYFLSVKDCVDNTPKAPLQQSTGIVRTAYNKLFIDKNCNSTLRHRKYLYKLFSKTPPKLMILYKVNIDGTMWPSIGQLLQDLLVFQQILWVRRVSDLQVSLLSVLSGYCKVGNVLSDPASMLLAAFS